MPPRPHQRIKVQLDHIRSSTRWVAALGLFELFTPIVSSLAPLCHCLGNELGIVPIFFFLVCCLFFCGKDSLCFSSVSYTEASCLYYSYCLEVSDKLHFHCYCCSALTPLWWSLTATLSTPAISTSITYNFSIHIPSTMTIKILSLNTKGPGHPAKRASLWKQATQSNCVVLCIQETCFHAQNPLKSSNKNFNNIFTAGAPGKKGHPCCYQ